ALLAVDNEQGLPLGGFELPEGVPNLCLPLDEVVADHLAPVTFGNGSRSLNRFAVPKPSRNPATSFSTIRSETVPSPAVSYGLIVRLARSRNSDDSALRTAALMAVASSPTSITLVARVLPSWRGPTFTV